MTDENTNDAMQADQEDIEEEDIEVEDIATDNEARIDALVELLVKKGVITEQEWEAAYDSQFEDSSEDS